MSVICIIIAIVLTIINNVGAQSTGMYLVALIIFVLGGILQASEK